MTGKVLRQRRGRAVRDIETGAAPEVRQVSHTYAQNVIHVVFSTKGRRKAISGELRPRMWAYAAGICHKLGLFVHAVGGTEDHIHFLIQVPPRLAVAQAVLAIKSNSSHQGPGEREIPRRSAPRNDKPKEFFDEVFM